MNRRLLFLLIAVLSLKAFLLALDPYPALMFGDSASYLATALIRWIPPDRSFVYGFIIRRLTVRFHLLSLMPAVFLQVFLSGIASWLVGVCLMKFFRARFSVAVACSLLCAIEPMQLMFERFILPDSLSTSIFAVLMFTVFSYLQRPTFALLACMQIISTLLVSLRLTFLPIAIVLSVLAPILVYVFRNPRRHVSQTLLIPLLLSVLLSQVLLFGYRIYYGYLIGKPPAYSYSDGSFLLAVVVPILKPTDFPIRAGGARNIDIESVYKAVQYPMSDPYMRPMNHWSEGGLVDLIQRSVGNSDEANAWMKKAALNAMMRDPAGVAKLALGLYLDFYDYDELRNTLKVEEGQFNAATPEQASMLQSAFNFNVQYPHFDSVTKTWHGVALPWYWFLLIFPFVYPIYLAFLAINIDRRRRIGPQHIVCAVFALMVLLETVTLVERIVTRYLVAEAWLVFVMIGAMAGAAVDAKKKMDGNTGDVPCT